MQASPRALRAGCAALLAALVAGCGDARDSILDGEPLYSQGNEELVIRHFFGDRRDGVFLDVGSAHYRKLSTTFYLEEHLGWSGIAIDAIAQWGEEYSANRPGTRFFAYIVTDHEGAEEPFFVVGPPAADSMAKGISSTDPERLQHLAPEKLREIRVPTITLDALLEREDVESIDFLSMDIEGGEVKALEGFDIERFRPELVCIETGGANRESVLAYFARHGYALLERYREVDPVNLYFAPAGA